MRDAGHPARALLLLQEHEACPGDRATPLRALGFVPSRLRRGRPGVHTAQWSPGVREPFFSPSWRARNVHRRRGMTNSLPEPKKMRRRARVSPPGRKRMAVVLAASLLGVGCGVDARATPVAPGLTFAAHTVHGGLVVDHMQNGDTGLAEPEGGWSSLTNPEFDVHFNGAGGDRRLVGTGPIVVHRGTSDEGPVSGRVEPSWDDQAIRLTLSPASGPPLTSDIFTRIDGGGGMEELTRNAQDSLDLRGSYQAALRDPDRARKLAGFASTSPRGRPRWRPARVFCLRPLAKAWRLPLRRPWAPRSTGSETTSAACRARRSGAPERSRRWLDGCREPTCRVLVQRAESPPAR